MQEILIKIKDSSQTFENLKNGEFFKWNEEIWVKVHERHTLDSNKHCPEYQHGCAVCVSKPTKSGYSDSSKIKWNTSVLPAKSVEINLTFEQ